MAFIGPRVHRYPLGPESLTIACDLFKRGTVLPPGIAECSDFIDIDT